MDIKFNNSFIESLKRLSWEESFFYKTYSLFRYDIPRFIGNIWRFRKGLWNHYWWDHHGMLKLMESGLVHMSDNLEKKGIEVDVSRLKKVEKIRRSIEIIRNYNEDRYIEIVEKELGKLFDRPLEFEDVPENPGSSKLVDNLTKEEKEHNSKVFKRSSEIGESEWNELWEIFKGQNINHYVMLSDMNKNSKDNSLWDNWFDGTGMRGWWD